MQVKLTIKQRKFIDYYLKFKNATEAAIKAGYSKKNADVIGAQNLGKLKIKQEIEKRLKKTQEKADISVEKLLREQAFIAFSRISDLFKGEIVISPDSLPEALQACIASIKINEKRVGKQIFKTYEYKFWDKPKVIEQLGRYLGMFQDKLHYCLVFCSINIFT